MGNGSGSGGTPNGGTGGAATPPCTDEPPDEQYTCADQASWGKCNEEWMLDRCNLSCGRCSVTPPGSGGGAGSGGSTDCGLAPANPKATGRARKLLCYLKNHTYLSGQTDVPDAEKVAGMTGRYPAMVAFDFYRYTDGDTSETQYAINWAKAKKGIVAFQWHWKAPGGGEFYADYDFAPALNDPNSKLYKDIDLVARELKKMGDAGVPVLFRPLHEANNNFMWWAKKGASNYKRLWKLIFDRTLAAGANDVLWVFNGMASGQNTALADWYPGANQVDVISSDYFQSRSDYDILARIGSDKVLAIAETFNALDPASEPPFNFWVVWASRDWGGKGAEASWKRAMANPKTISIDQLPDMTRW
jgi:hypothetical protein